MTPTRLIVGLLIISAVGGLTHYYLWRRLIRDAEFPRRWHRLLSGLTVLLALSQPAIFLLGRALPREQTAAFAFFAFTWMGLFSTYLVLTSAADLSLQLGRLLRWAFSSKKQAEAAPDPARRRLLGRAFSGGILAAGSTIGAAGVAQVVRGFDLVEVEVRLNKLPQEFDGFRIVQVSDIHVGPTIGRDFIAELVRVANSQTPDLIAITGDLVDGSVKNLARHTAPLGQLRAEHGVYFVTGNHEYYSGADDWIEELERIGIPTLRNRSVELRKQGASVLLAGVTDHRAGEFGDPPDLKRALRGRRPEQEVILLAHQPREIDQAQKHDVGLQLSGHTHGGQFWPWNWVVRLVQPVVSGLARFGRTQIYVNTGTGYWGPPMRSGTRSEMTLITLRSASEAPSGLA